MRLTSSIQDIEQALRTNATFMSLADSTVEGSSVSVEAEGLYFLLYKSVNGKFSSYLSESENGKGKADLNAIMTFSHNLERTANAIAE